MCLCAARTERSAVYGRRDRAWRWAMPDVVSASHDMPCDRMSDIGIPLRRTSNIPHDFYTVAGGRSATNANTALSLGAADGRVGAHFHVRSLHLIRLQLGSASGIPMSVVLERLAANLELPRACSHSRVLMLPSEAGLSLAYVPIPVPSSWLLGRAQQPRKTDQQETGEPRGADSRADGRPGPWKRRRRLVDPIVYGK